MPSIHGSGFPIELELHVEPHLRRVQSCPFLALEPARSACALVVENSSFFCSLTFRAIELV